MTVVVCKRVLDLDVSTIPKDQIGGSPIRSCSYPVESLLLREREDKGTGRNDLATFICIQRLVAAWYTQYENVSELAKPSRHSNFMMQFKWTIDSDGVPPASRTDMSSVFE